jgi:hypothetical protein
MPSIRGQLPWPTLEDPTSMQSDPAARQSGSWEVDPPHDRTMLALQYVVAVIAAAAAIVLSSLH